MKKLTKDMKKVQKVIKCIFRYEMGFSLKNSGFSYLYGSISYLFGYENFGCFFLMYLPSISASLQTPGRAELATILTIPLLFQGLSPLSFTLSSQSLLEVQKIRHCEQRTVRGQILVEATKSVLTDAG
jgi:hypothetical protein